MKSLVLVIAAVLVTVSSLYAFDGKRTGVVFGIGIALTPYSTVSPYYGEEWTGKGLGGHALLGVGFSSRDLIVAEGNGSYCLADEASFSQRYHAAQGFYGISWYHYYGRVNKSLFSVFGVGYYAFKVQYLPADEQGNALLLGVGYEFGSHIQFGLYYATGETGRRSPYITHKQINLMVSSIAF